eukprot:TRINITY_DN34797_c0_g1_i1.p1 TRINITY_DN34797_c0_g1~~TRINITY_DN34797_c0_g1_i1.p1  ORF type:complete len:331 (+),score=75.92 TRINITY_DN34797_c0_g1_i1:317-1309(+)
MGMQLVDRLMGRMRKSQNTSNSVSSDSVNVATVPMVSAVSDAASGIAAADLPKEAPVVESVESLPYKIRSVISSSSHRTVYRARDTISDKSVAVKVISRGGLPMVSDDICWPVRKAGILMSLSGHKNIVRVQNVLETQDCVVIQMEFCKGGSLADKIPEGGMSESQARIYFRQVVSALAYCHVRGVSHGDVSPSHILLTREGQVKLASFKHLGTTANQPRRTAQSFRPWVQDVKAVQHFAPEVLVDRSCRFDGIKADLWGCGTLLHLLLTGTLPYGASSTKSLIQKILTQRRANVELSSQARDLVEKLIVNDPAERLSLQGVMQHPWFTA